MKLHLRLNLIVAGLSATFVSVLLVAEVRGARESISEEITAANRVAGQLLGHLTGGEAPESAASVAEFLGELGRVRANDIVLYSVSGDVLYRSPPSTWKVGRDAPQWFAQLLTPQPLSQTYALANGGRLVVEAEFSRAVLDAWDAFLGLVLVGVGMLVVVNGAAFWLVGRALAPFPTITEGLMRLRRGELDYRLPALPGDEARVIGEAFNAMAVAVEDKVAAEQQAREAEALLEQRRELGHALERKLEEERRLIAHELHDEFSQSVTAIRSLALSITAQPSPDESRTRDTANMIADEAGSLYDAMHGLIPRLMPLSFDTLGLTSTLEDLVRAWRGRCPQVAIELAHELDADPGQDVTLTIYRLVQEGMINALRHGDPTRVEIDLSGDGDSILVSVVDDGRGLPDDWRRPGHFGLRGLRDRVAAHGGAFEVKNGSNGGVEVTARLPLEGVTSP